jgi:hypothetical protein
MITMITNIVGTVHVVIIFDMTIDTFRSVQRARGFTGRGQERIHNATNLRFDLRINLAAPGAQQATAARDVFIGMDRSARFAIQCRQQVGRDPFDCRQILRIHDDVNGGLIADQPKRFLQLRFDNRRVNVNLTMHDRAGNVERQLNEIALRFIEE